MNDFKNTKDTNEAAKILGILPDSVGYLIRSGKLKAEKTSKGHYRIQDSELEKRQQEKYKINGGEYLNKAGVEKLGYSSDILYNGTLETIRVNRVTVVETEEMFRYIKTKPIIAENEEKCFFTKTVVVGLRHGIDVKKACDICRICGNYLYKFKIKTTLIYEEQKWEYLGPFGDTVDQLVFKEIKQKNMVTIETIGIKVQAKELNDFLARVLIGC